MRSHQYHTTSIPQFASLTFLVDVSSQDNGCSLFSSPMVEFITVGSPLATTLPSTAYNTLYELHQFLYTEFFDEQSRSKVMQSSSGHEVGMNEHTSDLGNIAEVQRNVQQYRRTFQEQCLSYDKSRQAINAFSVFYPQNISCPLYLVYSMITEPAAVLRCTAIFLQASNKASSFHTLLQSSKKKSPILACILSIGLNQVSVNCITSFPSAQSWMMRFKECSDTIRMLQASIGTTPPCDQKRYLDIILTSILLDDEYVKTNDIIVIESNPDILMARSFMNSGIQQSTKSGMSVRKLPNLRFKREKKVFFDDTDSRDTALSTALISASASSSDLAKVVADQLQVLSLSEKNMNLQGYQHSTKVLVRGTNTIHQNSRFGAKSSQKSPIKTNRKSTKITKLDLLGFQCPDNFTHNTTTVDERTIQSVGSDLSACSGLSSSRSINTKSSDVVPTLQGSSRDSLSLATQQRKTRVLSASAAHTQTRITGMMNGTWNKSSQVTPHRLLSSLQQEQVKTVHTIPQEAETRFDPFPTFSDNKAENSIKYSYSSPDSLLAMDTKDSLDTFLDDMFDDSPNKIEPREQSSKVSLKRENTRLLVTFAINEDLSCVYRNSKLSSSSIEGVVQIQGSCEEFVNAPLRITLNDPSEHLEVINALSPSIKSLNTDETKFDYIINLPFMKKYVPIFKYKCSSKLRPVPLRVQSRIRINGSLCRVALQISTNPENLRSLSNIKISLVLPPNAKGETAVCQPSGGKWYEETNSIQWIVAVVGIGEKIQMQAQVELERLIENSEVTPSFPVLVQCECLYTLLSNIQLSAHASQSQYDVTTAYARRFRIFYKDMSNIARP